MPKPGYEGRRGFSLKMQAVAIAKVYQPLVWPGYQITELDRSPGELAKTIDIGGGDKLLSARDGHIIFVGQRFRRKEQWDRGWRDFTLREAEYNRHMIAAQNSGFIPGYYVYGYATQTEDDFIALRIIDYLLWWKDLLAGRITMKFKETRFGQENFYYYEDLLGIPEKYLVFNYPDLRSNICNPIKKRESSRIHKGPKVAQLLLPFST